MEQATFDCLCARHGSNAVFAEQDTGAGTKIDIAVKVQGGLWLYEIKTSTCVRSCIREGLAQLLEYAFWTQGMNATKLVVVAEVPVDAAAVAFLTTLRQRYGLPVYYSRLDYEAKTLEPEQ